MSRSLREVRIASVLLSFILLSFALPSPVLAQAVETEPNDAAAQANVLPVANTLSGTIAGGADLNDWYRVILPQGGSFELAMEATATGGAGNADVFTTIYRANAVSSIGTINIFDVPVGETRRDTFRIFGRAARDTIFVRMSQSVGGFNYKLHYANQTPSIPSEAEPNDVAAQALPLVKGVLAQGQIGYTRNATTDLNDWYRTVLPEGGSFELSLTGLATSGAGNGDIFVTVYRANAVSSLGTINQFDVPQGSSAAGTFRIFGRAPGDTIFVRVSQSVGSFDYGLRFTSEPPTITGEREPNNTAATALPLLAGRAVEGQLGYTLNNVTDLQDWYRVVLPAGGSFELSLEGTATSGAGNADIFATVFRANSVSSIGTIQLFDVPQGSNESGTFQIFGRAPGDTIYVRLTQSVGSFDYRLVYETVAPTLPIDKEPNDVAASALILAPGVEAIGQLGYTLDATTDLQDWYRVVLPAGGSFELSLEGTATSGAGNADIFATVFRANRVSSIGSIQLYDVPQGSNESGNFRFLAGRQGTRSTCCSRNLWGVSTTSWCRRPSRRRYRLTGSRMMWWGNLPPWWRARPPLVNSATPSTPPPTYKTGTAWFCRKADA